MKFRIQVRTLFRNWTILQQNYELKIEYATDIGKREWKQTRNKRRILVNWAEKREVRRAELESDARDWFSWPWLRDALITLRRAVTKYPVTLTLTFLTRTVISNRLAPPSRSIYIAWICIIFAIWSSSFPSTFYPPSVVTFFRNIFPLETRMTKVDLIGHVLGKTERKSLAVFALRM